jgi:excisionase family DNA binding protein
MLVAKKAHHWCHRSGVSFVRFLRGHVQMTALLDVKQAAALLGISPWTLRAYLGKGELTPVRIGRRVLLEEAELQAFIAERRAEA